MCFFDKFGTLVEILHLRGSKTEHLVIRYIYTYMHIDAIGRDGAENPHHSVSMVFFSRQILERTLKHVGEYRGMDLKEMALY